MSMKDAFIRLFSAAARAQLRTQRQLEQAAEQEKVRLIVESPLGLNLFARHISPEKDAALIRGMKRYNQWIENNHWRFSDVKPAPRFISRSRAGGWLVGYVSAPDAGYMLLPTDKSLCNFMKDVARYYVRAQASKSFDVSYKRELVA